MRRGTFAGLHYINLDVNPVTCFVGMINLSVTVCFQTCENWSKYTRVEDINMDAYRLMLVFYFFLIFR